MRTTNSRSAIGCLAVLIVLAWVGPIAESAPVENKCQHTPPPMFYANPEDCTKFFQCAHGVAYPKTCHPGTVFSETLNVCVTTGFEHDSCTPHNAERECRLGNADLIPHPDACQLYYNCSDIGYQGMYSMFRPYEEECQYPKVFDMYLKRCVDYQVARCGPGRVTATWECDYRANRCPRSHCIPCAVFYPSCVGKEDGLWPHSYKGEWNPYYANCKSGRAIGGELRCPQHPLIGNTQLFHPQRRECVSLWEIPSEHGGYQPECQDGVADGYYPTEHPHITYQCPGEKLYFCPNAWFAQGVSVTQCTQF